jgi:hypothetical protein
MQFYFMSKDARFLNQIETNIFLKFIWSNLIFSTFWYDCANASEWTESEVIKLIHVHHYSAHFRYLL